MKDREPKLPEDVQKRFDAIWGSDVWDGGKIHPVDIEEFLIEELSLQKKQLAEPKK